MREVIAAAERVTGRKVPVVIAPRRAGDPSVLVGDATWARRDLAWQPQHADIDEIVGTAWRWLQQYQARKGEVDADTTGAQRP